LPLAASFPFLFSACLEGSIYHFDQAPHEGLTGRGGGVMGSDAVRRVWPGNQKRRDRYVVKQGKDNK